MGIQPQLVSGRDLHATCGLELGLAKHREAGLKYDEQGDLPGAVLQHGATGGQGTGGNARGAGAGAGAVSPACLSSRIIQMAPTFLLASRGKKNEAAGFPLQFCVSHLHGIALGNTCDFDGTTLTPSRRRGGQVFSGLPGSWQRSLLLHFLGSSSRLQHSTTIRWGKGGKTSKSYHPV